MKIGQTCSFDLPTFQYVIMNSTAVDGAGHCPWGGCTDQNLCNIHGEVRLASCCHTMLRPRTFSTFGTLPAKLAPCQYCQMFLEGAPCYFRTFGRMPKSLARCQKYPTWPCLVLRLYVALGVKFDLMTNIVMQLHNKMIAHKSSAFCTIIQKLVETLKRSGY